MTTTLLSPMQNLDAHVLLFFNRSLANPIFDVLMPTLTMQGYLLITPVLLFCILQGVRTLDASGKRRLITAVAAIALACLAVYVADWIENFIKNALMRQRPCRTLADIRLIIPCPKSYSLPSGHAMSSFAFAAPFTHLSRGILARSWRVYTVVLASVIAFSRLYLGVHYLTDVIAGVLLGTGIGLSLAILFEKIRNGITRQGEP